jgi:transcriptional regulator with XRE-family HTH domain
LDYAKQFGRRLKTLRKAKKLNQAQLAEKTDMEAQSISNLETGHRTPSFETIRSLAEALNVPVSALFLFEKDENDAKILRKRIEAILDQSTPQQLKLIYRHARDVMEP